MGAWISFRIGCLGVFSTGLLELIFDFGRLNFFWVCPRLFNQLLLGWALGLPFDMVAWTPSRLGSLNLFSILVAWTSFGCAQDVLINSFWDGRLDFLSNWVAWAPSRPGCLTLFSNLIAWTAFGCAQDCLINSFREGRLEFVSHWLLGLLLDWAAWNYFRIWSLALLSGVPKIF